ncbi:hypothetical protein [Eisenibacter elegans]|uniref:hypothetical protein n=1 Tax=Eisenibacter elegans TaxID=997 RepID=UPI000415F987|nr:hypothetical protein [Eisenibacter elegans]
MKTQKSKLSRTYINQYGQIRKDYNTLEKVGLRISQIFKVLPFIVSVILCSLLVVQVFCLFGLLKTLFYPTNVDDLAVYMFLFIAISVICSLGFGIAWFLVEEKEDKTTILSNQSHQKYLNDELDAWQN